MGFRCCKYKVETRKDLCVPTDVYCGHDAPPGTIHYQEVKKNIFFM